MDISLDSLRLQILPTKVHATPTQSSYAPRMEPHSERPLVHGMSTQLTLHPT